MELVSMRNEHENELIRNFVLAADSTFDPKAFPWIGLHHDATTSWDQPQWSDTSRVRFTNWARNEPSQLYQVRRDSIDLFYYSTYISYL